MKTVSLVTAEAELVSSTKASLEPDFRVRPYLIKPRAIGNLKAQLEEIILEILGTADGNIDTGVVIIDDCFEAKRGRRLLVGEPLFDTVPPEAGSTLAMLLGAGIPVLVHYCTSDFVHGWQVGRSRAQLLDRNEIRKGVATAVQSLPYSRQTLAVENQFAKVYDEEELGSPATVSAILNENEYIIQEVLRVSEERMDPLRILDLGCGTGRFEEVLLADSRLRNKIAQIVAVDFAPEYLVQATRRLPHFLSNRQLQKVTFLRRIAEDLQWPSDYFDVVLASFGIVCFSRTHLTLQEARRVLRPSGLAVFNGYNRSALTYLFDEQIAPTETPITHFAIHIDRETNKMYLGDSVIHCMTFDVDGFQNLLTAIGFEVRHDAMRTFPTLYGSARKEYIEAFNGRTSGRRLTAHRAGSCKKRGGPCKRFASYQSGNLEHLSTGGFNPVLHRMDNDLARVLPNTGFYFCTAARRAELE